MFEFLWLIPALPLAGFAALALAGPRLGRRASAVVGAGVICSAASLGGGSESFGRREESSPSP